MAQFLLASTPSKNMTLKLHHTTISEKWVHERLSNHHKFVTPVTKRLHPKKNRPRYNIQHLKQIIHTSSISLKLRTKTKNTSAVFFPQRNSLRIFLSQAAPFHHEVHSTWSWKKHFPCQPYTWWLSFYSLAELSQSLGYPTKMMLPLKIWHTSTVVFDSFPVDVYTTFFIFFL